ncbi:hypothetical protein FRB96_001162 [Tulasnella sp. 330]|nr:hypothetical protein FRB96_001162 [Tulasnella sp. 330]
MDTSIENNRIVGYKPILAMVVFLLTNVLVMFPFNVRAPYKLTGRRRHVKLSTTVIAPLLGVLLLLASRAINGTTLKRGILGADGIKPIDIMALFISLAVRAKDRVFKQLSTSALISEVNFAIISNSGKRLYIYLYLLFFFAGVIAGNDPVILSGTAFLAYMTRVAGIVPPTAWIFAQFTSAVLVSSNPTNLVLTGAFQISFTTYTANVILPSLTSAIVLLPYLLWKFRSKYVPSGRSARNGSYPLPPESDGNGITPRQMALIPTELYTNDLPPASTALVDKNGAIFGSVLLMVTLVTLLTTSAAAVNVEVWSITVPAALIMLIRDIWWDIWGHEMQQTRSDRSQSDLPTNRNEENAQPEPVEPIELRVQSLKQGEDGGVMGRSSGEVMNRSRTRNWIRDLRPLGRARHALPTCHLVMSRLPFFAILFAFCMFILVQSLGSAWIAVFARWWTVWVHRTGTVGAVLGMYVLTVAGCNFMGTNIGATILLARVLQQWQVDAAPTNRTMKAAVYALALGSNYGAFSATFSASLAGLLWRNILRQKGIHVHQREFARLNAGINVVAMLFTSADPLAHLLKYLAIIQPYNHFPIFSPFHPGVTLTTGRVGSPYFKHRIRFPPQQPWVMSSVIIIPVLASHNHRYRTSSHAEASSSNLIASLSVSSFISGQSSLPIGWRAWVHPDGDTYYAHEDMHIVTAADPRDSALLRIILATQAQFKKHLTLGRFSQSELYVNFTSPDDDRLVIEYYFADHSNHQLFWLCDETPLAELGMASLGSLGEIKCQFKSEYWTHVEYFQIHIPVSGEVENETIGILRRGYINGMTSPGSTFPFSEQEFQNYLKIFEGFGSQDRGVDLEADGYRNPIIARIRNAMGLPLFTQGRSKAKTARVIRALRPDLPPISKSTIFSSICATIQRLTSHPSIQRHSSTGSHHIRFDKPKIPVAGGGFSDVFRGFDLVTRRPVAMKRFRCSTLAPTEVEDAKRRFIREAQNWSELDHENILTFLGMFEISQEIYLVSYWQELGDITHFVQDRLRFLELPKDERCNHPLRAAFERFDEIDIVHGIASGLAHLHANNIIHGDVKGFNVLLNPQVLPLLSDFGMAKVIKDDFMTSAGMKGAGSLRWMAPESLQEAPRTPKCDIYSLGMTIVEAVPVPVPIP